MLPKRGGMSVFYRTGVAYLPMHQNCALRKSSDHTRIFSVYTGEICALFPDDSESLGKVLMHADLPMIPDPLAKNLEPEQRKPFICVKVTK